MGIRKRICVVPCFTMATADGRISILRPLPQKALEGSRSFVDNFWLLFFWSSCPRMVSCIMKCLHQIPCSPNQTTSQRGMSIRCCLDDAVSWHVRTACCRLSCIHLSHDWLNPAPARLKSLPCGCGTVCGFVWGFTCLNPSQLQGLCGWGCMCAGREGRESHPLLYKGSPGWYSATNLQIFFNSLLHHRSCNRLCSSVTMTSLLTALVAALCVSTVSSEIMPQADFNLQAVRHTTVNCRSFFLIIILLRI